MHTPIDAVISWVDGYDPVYQKKLSDFCLQQGLESRKVVEPTRIQQCGEILYCLHSLRLFAPWLRTIYLVTDGQVPRELEVFRNTPFGDKLRVIDQQTLFSGFEHCLPVFNSLTIEWLLWRIEGLAEHFLYLNDDFFITRPVKPTDFFRDGRLVLRGHWKTRTDQQVLQRLKTWWHRRLGRLEPKPVGLSHRAWQEESAKQAGWTKRFYLLPHAPFPLLKKTFETFCDTFPQTLADNVCYAFRHQQQLSPLPLMVHLDMKHDRVVYDRTLYAIMINGACHSLRKIKTRLHQARRKKCIAFVCIQSLDQAPDTTQHYLLGWLSSMVMRWGMDKA